MIKCALQQHTQIVKNKIKIHLVKIHVFNLYPNKERIHYKMLKITSATKEAGNSFQHFSNSYTLKDEYYHH